MNVEVGNCIEMTQIEADTYLVAWNTAIFDDGSTYRMVMQAESRAALSLWKRVK